MDWLYSGIIERGQQFLAAPDYLCNNGLDVCSSNKQELPEIGDELSTAMQRMKIMIL